MQCRICGQEAKEKFRHQVLNKYDVAFFHCDNCGFLQTEAPYWLQEAYADPINKSDTGLVLRNLFLAKKAFVLFLAIFGKKGKFLDYAGGYGIMTRLLRDFGLDCYWDDKYAQNIFASGFEYSHQKIEALTCFECFEHFVDPPSELEKMLAISRNIFFSTTLFGDKVPAENFPYYSFGHGQHIAFYSLKTLKYLAEKYNLFFYSNGKDLHFFSEKKISPLKFKLLLKIGMLPWDVLSRFIMPGKTLSDSQSIADNPKD